VLVCSSSVGFHSPAVNVVLLLGNLNLSLPSESSLSTTTAYLIICSILAATWKLSRFAQANISGGNAVKALD
jgi:hypothetical protein